MENTADDAHDASGVAFGHWQTDGDGLPRFAYTLDHGRDPRAQYRTSDGVSRDHWHAVANDRITALAHNEGYVEVLDWDRCGKYLNRWEPKRRQFAGGYTYAYQRGRTWSTLWSQLPAQASQKRYFGMGYVEKRTRFEEFSITERIEAPPGNAGALVCTTSLTNESDHIQEFVWLAYWGVNLHILLPFPVMTHRFKHVAAAWRRQFNRYFVQSMHVDEALKTAWACWDLKHPEKAPPRDRASFGDYYPPSVFLTSMEEGAPPAFITDGRTFFDEDGFPRPEAMTDERNNPASPHCDARRADMMLGLKRAATLRPGETVRERFLYGYVHAINMATAAAGIKASLAAAPKMRSYISFHVPEVPWLDREVRWHSYYLQANTIQSEFYDTRFVDQGSAYGMLHGASGAHRDFALSILSLSYLRPDIARDMLRFSMCAQDGRTGALPYAHIGVGKVSGAGIHARSSDLDLFFLWAAAEYLGATHDFSLLEETVPYHPKQSGHAGTGLEHLQRALTHLVHHVGFGSHSLLRCGTGDWNDALVAFSRRKLATIRKGESMLNAGLAAFALSLLADILGDRAPEFALALRDIATGQARAARNLWTGRWWARGYTGIGDRILGEDRLFLDCQAFPVLAGLLDAEQRAALLKSVERTCIQSQPSGASCMHPPMRGLFLEPGADTNGGVWAAVNAWTAWSLSEMDAQAGWDFFLRTTMKQRAEAYPDIWYGIWSGPDGYNACSHNHPGETYLHAVTPMTDFPVMNSNWHAGPLLDIIKLSGICPRGNTLFILPKIPFDTFALNTPLMGFSYKPDFHCGQYTPVVSGEFSFAVREPVRTSNRPLELFLDNVPVAIEPKDGLYHFTTFGSKGKAFRWELQ